jgi:hypothetical protein
MSKIFVSTNTEAKAAISTLIENTPPVLVEVRFPHSGTSPDWYLFEDEEQLEQLLERLGSGVELCISSVWHLKNVEGKICLKK